MIKSIRYRNLIFKFTIATILHERVIYRLPNEDYQTKQKTICNTYLHLEIKIITHTKLTSWIVCTHVGFVCAFVCNNISYQWSRMVG